MEKFEIKHAIMGFLMIAGVILIGAVLLFINADKHWKKEYGLQSLEQEGASAEATIVKKVNRATGIRDTRGQWIVFTFSVDGITYRGKSRNNNLYALKVGETFEVIYLPYKPEVFIPRADLERRKKHYLIEQRYFNPFSEKFFLRELFN